MLRQALQLAKVRTNPSLLQISRSMKYYNYIAAPSPKRARTPQLLATAAFMFVAVFAPPLYLLSNFENYRAPKSA